MYIEWFMYSKLTQEGKYMWCTSDDDNDDGNDSDNEGDYSHWNMMNPWWW